MSLQHWSAAFDGVTTPSAERGTAYQLGSVVMMAGASVGGEAGFIGRAGGSRIALSLGEHLEAFEVARGARGWLWWDGAGSFETNFGRAASRADGIDFNLTGLDLKRVAAGADWSRTGGLVTNAEFRSVISNPALLAKTTFYRGGIVIKTEQVLAEYWSILAH